jgi:hypothetical protein
VSGGRGECVHVSGFCGAAHWPRAQMGSANEPQHTCCLEEAEDPNGVLSFVGSSDRHLVLLCFPPAPWQRPG